MLLRKWNVQLIAAVFALAFASVSAHDTTFTKPQQEQIQENLETDEDDDTDALAIPSDSSAVEQREEMKELKQLERTPEAPVKK